MDAVSAQKRERRNLMVLVIAAGYLGAQMPMMFTVAGLAGQSLATNVCFATLPISLIVLGSMLTATPLSSLMQRFPPASKRMRYLLDLLPVIVLPTLLRY